MESKNEAAEEFARKMKRIREEADSADRAAMGSKCARTASKRSAVYISL